MPTASGHTVRAHAIGELHDLGDALFAALLHDVGCAEGLGERLALGVAGHDDNLLRAELLGADDCAQADCTVTDNDDGLTGACLRGVCCVPAGAENVGAAIRCGICSSVGGCVGS